MSFDTFVDFNAGPPASYQAEIRALQAELDVVRRERDAARQAVRDLVDATNWYDAFGTMEDAHIQVDEKAMERAMALIVDWFGEKA